MSTQNERGFWTRAVNLGDSVNTRGKEFYPYIHPDNKTLYFSSDGHLGMGSMDKFISRRANDDEPWQKPVNIGYPINTSSVEHGLFVSNDGTTAYFSSNRLDGAGGLDLYYFDLHKAARPSIVSYIKGIVYDKDTKTPIKADFEIVDIETNKVLIESNSDEMNGEFLISLPAGKDYALNISRKGYLFYSDHFSSRDAVSREHAYLLDVPLVKAKEGASVVLKNIFFKTNSYELEDKSRTELDKLFRFMSDNPDLIVEISGHTDNVGSVEDNQKLSQNRAAAVRDYLTKQGIAQMRLKHKGFGEGKPIADNESEEGRAKNRRTEFKIVGKS